MFRAASARQRFNVEALFPSLMSQIQEDLKRNLRNGNEINMRGIMKNDSILSLRIIEYAL